MVYSLKKNLTMSKFKVGDIIRAVRPEIQNILVTIVGIQHGQYMVSYFYKGKEYKLIVVQDSYFEDYYCLAHGYIIKQEFDNEI